MNGAGRKVTPTEDAVLRSMTAAAKPAFSASSCTNTITGRRMNVFFKIIVHLVAVGKKTKQLGVAEDRGYITFGYNEIHIV